MAQSPMDHFVCITDSSTEQICHVLDVAFELRRQRAHV